MEVLKYGNPLLRKRSKVVRKGDSEIAGLMEQMLVDMHRYNGIGLAAPQVGILKRVVVIHIPLEPELLYKLINPKIIWASSDFGSCDEGCLSLPGVYETVERPISVSVQYLDENFNPRIIEKAEGIFAVCLQHEIDHLDGKLFIDHLNRGKRSEISREFRKKQREEASSEEAKNKVVGVSAMPRTRADFPNANDESSKIIEKEAVEVAEEIADALG